MGKTKEDEFNRLSQELNNRVKRNITALLNYRNLSKSEFTKALNTRVSTYSRPHISNLLQEKGTQLLPLAFVVLCCDFFGITLENLLSENFDASEYISNSSSAHQTYLDITQILEKLEREKLAEQTLSSNTDPTIAGEAVSQDKIFHFDHWLSDTNSLVCNPDHLLFNGYLQDYYCYYYPTVSSENTRKSLIIRGILSLKKEGSMCKAVLKINTSGEPNQYCNFNKEYVGYAVISIAVRNLLCIMYSKDLGEFCFLSFRHFKLNKDSLYCRMAEVLSSSSGSEERCPIVQRIFLSSEIISESDLPFISSSLLFNHSNITVPIEALKTLGQKSKEYAAISNALLETTAGKSVLILNEQSDVLHAAQRILKKQCAALEYVFHLRSLSYSFRYNKVSSFADKNITNFLRSKGYYQKKQSTVENGLTQSSDT